MGGNVRVGLEDSCGWARHARQEHAEQVTRLPHTRGARTANRDTRRGAKMLKLKGGRNVAF